MTKIKVYNQAGKEVGEAKLEPKIFDVAVRLELVQQAVRTQLANKRAAIAHTKDRSEVRGGGRKPWRQKGTGRARHGSIRSPLWKGGGVTFGPRNDRNYSLKINKKAKRKALFMALTDKAKDKKIVILDKLAVATRKTKDFLAVISMLPLKNSLLVILPKSEEKTIKAARNLPFVKTVNADSLNIVDILTYEYLLMPQESLTVMEKTFLKK